LDLAVRTNTLRELLLEEWERGRRRKRRKDMYSDDVDSRLL
jgi:hypothetical protein